MSDTNKVLFEQLEQLKTETERISNESKAIINESESFDQRFWNWIRKGIWK